jgi:hypothetical protein
VKKVIKDKRYKDGVDKGRFGNHTIPLPLKKITLKIEELSLPKQVIRQMEAKEKNKLRVR